MKKKKSYVKCYRCHTIIPQGSQITTFIGIVRGKGNILEVAHHHRLTCYLNKMKKK